MMEMPLKNIFIFDLIYTLKDECTEVETTERQEQESGVARGVGGSRTSNNGHNNNGSNNNNSI